MGGTIGYTESLNIQPAMSHGQFAPTYTLYGVICHAGGGPNSGHYYAFVRGGDRKWYEMNDDSVVQCHQPPLNRQSAYMLFYLKAKGQGLDSVVTAATAAPPRAALASATRVSELDKIRQGLNKGPARDDRGVPIVGSFIGPLLPPQLAKPDPQAAAIERKIAAAAVATTKPTPKPTPKPSAALAHLTAYSDDSDDSSHAADVSAPIGTSLAPAAEITSSASISTPATPAPMTSSPTRFYGNENSSGQNYSRKRKSPDGDDRPSNNSYKNDRRPPHSLPFSPLTASSSAWANRGNGNPWDRARKYQHNSKVYGKHNNRHRRGRPGL